jgi:peptidoglycan hydrolase CwlO-like protein
MPRPPKGRVGRSAGVAEHRATRHRIVIRLSRTTTFTRVSALACVVALALAGAPSEVAAQTAASGSIDSTRRAVDTTATQWFAAQRQAADLDLQIETLTKTLAKLQPRVDQLREVANSRAVELYESNTHALGNVTDMMGDNPLDIGRRAALIGQANANGQAVIDELEASISDLNSQRTELRDARSEQAQTLQELSSRRRTLDVELASLEEQSSATAARAALATSSRRGDETATTAEPTRSAAVALTVAPAPLAESVPTAPPDTGAVSPHHDDPFLVCTRARESSGNYSVASSAGYYGAYQFSPTTWNVTASHSGRLELVGVLPSHASAYDQDEMAWSLYQWQGDGPWGGRC